ncbi:MAG TPA: PKD domain-containing protein [Gemmatimonadales bacterium]|nr:PKD domain-containing protein [Gemmatimonadales bacterium]
MKTLRLIALLALGAVPACKSPTPPPPPPPGAPVVDAGQNGSVQVGGPFGLSATFTDTTSGAAPWNYDVNWGDGTTASGTKSSVSPITGTHAYAAEGDYHVTVSVTNSLNVTGTDGLTVDATAPVIIAAGDIGDCTRTSDEATGALLDTIPGTVMPLGDNAYVSGTPTEYANCYDPAWGRVKNRTRPVPGNHDYYNPGPSKNADGYFGYFGAAAGPDKKGYYDFTLGSWFIIVLNTGTENGDSIKAGSAQEQWLRAELASHSQQCTLALWHHPQFTTVTGRPFIRPETTALFQALYDGGVDLLLNGHDHTYQRFAPMRADGTADAAFGVRQFTVGTGGGEGLYGFGPATPNLEVRAGNGEDPTFGVLKLTLHESSYDWKFIPAPGFGSFTDSGTSNCHGRPS